MHLAGSNVTESKHNQQTNARPWCCRSHKHAATPGNHHVAAVALSLASNPSKWLRTPSSATGHVTTRQARSPIRNSSPAEMMPSATRHAVERTTCAYRATHASMRHMVSRICQDAATQPTKTPAAQESHEMVSRSQDPSQNINMRVADCCLLCEE